MINFSKVTRYFSKVHGSDRIQGKIWATPESHVLSAMTHQFSSQKMSEVILFYL